MIHHPQGLVGRVIRCQDSSLNNSLWKNRSVCDGGKAEHSASTCLLARVGQPLPLLLAQSAPVMRSKQDCGRQEAVLWAGEQYFHEQST